MKVKPTYEELENRIKELNLKISKDVVEEQVEIKNKTLEGEESYKALFESIGDAIYIQDYEAKFVDVNKGVLNMYGYSKEELIGNTPLFLSAPDMNDMPAVFESFDKVKQGIPQVFEFWGKRKNGKIFPKTVGQYKGTYFGQDVVISVARDISNQIKAQQELAKSHYRESAMFNAVPDLIFRINKSGFFIDYKADVKDLYFQKETIIGKKYTDILPPNIIKNIEIKIQSTLETGLLQTLEYDLEIPAKGKIKYEARFLKSGADEVIVIIRDITEQKKIEQQLKERENQLTELNATKDKFFSIISHDLRSPFNTILGFSDLLSSHAKTYDTEKVVKFSAQINLVAVNTLALLDNLLNWAKSQTGQITFKPVKLNFKSIIVQTIDILNPIAEFKNIALSYIQSDAIEVYADGYMLKTILRNLITNAIKFTNSKGTIVVNALPKNNFIEITVSDDGIGMNNEIRNKLFTLQTNKTTLGTANEKGSGLGLVLCKELVEKHGGAIWVASEPKKGAVFHFTLPNDIVLDKNENKDSNTNLQIATKKTPTILVVEDEETNYQYVEAILEGEFKLIHALNGKEGLKLFNNNDIDLILMDINMPIMNGIEATKEIRKTNKEIPIIALTAYAMPEYKDKVLKVGCNYFLSKPVSRNLLLESINNHLRVTIAV